MTLSVHWRRFGLCVVAALLTATQVRAQGKEKGTAKVDEEFQKQVNTAIDGGVAYLRSLQKEDGTWQFSDLRHNIGATALAGLALLESGVEPTDAAVKKAANAVRLGSLDLTLNYSIATSILFLDRLGDAQDTPLIQSLGVRLLAAHYLGSGGWAYDSPPLGDAEKQRLQAVITARKEPAKFVPLKDRKLVTVAELPLAIREQLKAIERQPQIAPDKGRVIDNSNTQFALMGLWVARRHGILGTAADRAITITDLRLRKAQEKLGGAWAYLDPPPGVRPQQILMMLKMGNPDAGPNIQMTCCGLIGLGLRYGVGARKDPSLDNYITTGLAVLGGKIGHPTGDVAKAPKLPPPSTNKSYYALWVLERTAVLYHLKKIGGKDWYRWGAEILLNNQDRGGGWNGAFAAGGCDTCFALLFLKRANLTSDLEFKLKAKDLSKPLPRPPILEMIPDPLAGKGRRMGPGGPGGPGGRRSLAPPPERPAQEQPRPRFTWWRGQHDPFQVSRFDRSVRWRAGGDTL